MNKNEFIETILYTIIGLEIVIDTIFIGIIIVGGVLWN